MKKATGKLLSALLILTLVFTSASAVFADSGENANGEMKAAAGAARAEDTADAALSGQDVEKQVRAATAKSAATTKASGSFSLITMTTGKEQPVATNISYGINDTISGNYKGYAQPVTFKSKGVIIMAARAASTGTSGSVEFGLYRDRALTAKVDYTGYASANGNVDDQIIQVPSAGTYYLGVKSYISEYSNSQNYVVAVSCAYVSGGDRTLSNKKQIMIGQKDAQTNYFKFKAVRNGYLKVQTSDSYNNKVTLCNSKKKALSNTYYASYATYGVKKGRTYYIKIAARSSQGGYDLKVTNTAISEKSGKNKSRAVLVKKKKTKKGTIVAGENRADWYKFRLTGKKQVRLTVRGATNNKMKIAIYKGNKRVGSGTFSKYNKGINFKSYGKLTKGTYYIKVYRGTKNSSGWYSLNWR